MAFLSGKARGDGIAGYATTTNTVRRKKTCFHPPDSIELTPIYQNGIADHAKQGLDATGFK